MSQKYWAVAMYGVNLEKLAWKEDDELTKLSRIQKYLADTSIEKEDFCLLDFLREEVFGGINEATVILPNEKKVILGWEQGEKCSYIGFSAGYPWEDFMKGIDKEDVHDAMWRLLGNYLEMSQKDLDEQLGCISTYNYG